MVDQKRGKDLYAARKQRIAERVFESKRNRNRKESEFEGQIRIRHFDTQMDSKDVRTTDARFVYLLFAVGGDTNIEFLIISYLKFNKVFKVWGEKCFCG